MKPVPYLVKDVDALIQYVATGLAARGYQLYLRGEVPARCDPEKLDEKLIRRFDANKSRWDRGVRKQRGMSSARYVRCGRHWACFFTKGHHPRLADERQNLRNLRKNLRNLRRQPFIFADYSISLKRGKDGKLKASVRLNNRAYRELRDVMLEASTRLSVGAMEWSFERLPLQCWKPIRRQLLTIYRKVNANRLWSGREILRPDCVPWRRAIVTVFEDP